MISLQCCKLNAQDTSETQPIIGTNQKIGDVILIALPVAALGTTLLKGDKKGAWQFTKGFVVTEAVTYGLKMSINKTRPDQSNDNSFPSGHTSTVFHSAGYIHRRYGFKYSIPAYLLAGFTAASRIDSKKHDILDIIAGAAIGLGSNLLFTTEYQQKHMQLSYSSFEGNHMIGFSYKF
ncbi:phosphatase PAP2 family protein [Leeuwenhoekiella aequorea]|uniref:phosphatase PAP2 family protein n=1 Tax=Leeuwenhoekiella aequorea TaxID=283736 RepID=UPI00352C2F5C|tara:strand:+ start:7611 stop:8144 length:534 start_codon:yes stop_codon:yes gene_type:complete